MAKKIFATDTEISEFLKTSQAQLVEEIRNLKKKKFQTRQAEGVTLNFKLKEIEDDRKATIAFSQKAWIKIFALVNTHTTEIEWHGVVERLSDNDFAVNDILIFPHEVTATTVVSDQSTYEAWLNELDDNTFNSLRFHGHSHVNMGVTPSSVDMDYRKTILDGFGLPPHNANDFYIFLIINKKGDVESEIYDLQNNALYTTNEIKIKHDDCDWLTDFLKLTSEVVKERTYDYTKKLNCNRYPSANNNVNKGGTNYAGQNSQYGRRQKNAYIDDAPDSLESEYYNGVYGIGRYGGFE